MTFRSLLKYLFCTLILTTAPSINVDAQVGRAVKSFMNETSTIVGKWFGKKTTKETVEEGIKQGTKAISKEIAQRTIARNIDNAIFTPYTTINTNILEEVAAANIKKTLTLKVSKEVSEIALRSASKEFAEHIGKTTTKEAQEYFVKRLGTEGSQEIRELSVKESMQRNAFETKKSWDEKLKDKYHQLKLELSQTIHKSKAYKELLGIYAKGPICLSEKEMADLLANPKNNIRSLLKVKVGKKKNVVEFLIRLKMCNPEYVKQILDNKDLWPYIKESIRGGGKHEWLMVKNLKSFLFDPKWGDNGDLLALSLTKLSQATNRVNFKIGGGHGTSGRPNSPEARAFHDGLSEVIDNSASIEELYINIRRYAKKHLRKEDYNEFLRVLQLLFE